ncbi:MAG: nuclear transport factor 2 family protein [Gammaproteobacteria bacterium]
MGATGDRPPPTTPGEAEEAFYDAFERADFAAMRRLWADGDDVVCVHPLGPTLRGARAVMDSWRTMFRGGASMRFTRMIQQQFLQDEVAINVVHEFIQVTGERGTRPPMIATNAYRRQGGTWHMILHHASPSPEHFEAAVAPAAAIH